MFNIKNVTILIKGISRGNFIVLCYYYICNFKYIIYEVIDTLCMFKKGF